MDIFDLIDPFELEEMIEAGYVSAQQHPLLPLTILNYTHRCQYDRAWNATTMKCRGIIYGTQDGVIYARPWAKFFNYGEPTPEGLVLDPDALVEVTDKLDGSLGIGYFDPTWGGLSIATRGSFTSDQALHASKLYQRRYAHWMPEEGWTPLFEIIYPENRIVVDYGGEDDLHMIGQVKIETGELRGPSLEWPGPMAALQQALTFRDAVALPERPGKEGVVVRLLETDALVKIKQADYVELHRIVTHLNERTVWEAIVADRFEELIETLPDEFMVWAENVRRNLQAEADYIEARIREKYASATSWMQDRHGSDWSRKQFAELVTRQPEWAPYMFLLLDGKNVHEKIWASIRPEAAKPLMDRGEEIA